MEQSSEQYVRSLYYSILRRPPDEAGLRHHTALLDSGALSPEALKAAFESSDEALELRRRYEEAFGGRDRMLLKLASPRFESTLRAEGPKVIEVEVSSRCNITPACVMCDIDLAGKAFDIPIETVRKISPLFAHATQVLLHGIGEPLMNRDLLSIIELVPDRSHTGFNTNGLLLTKAVSEKLVALGVGWLNISVDAATAETYRKIRRNDFARLVANISNLTQTRGGRKLPQIFMNMTLMKENVAEAPAFVRLAARLGVDQVIFQQMNLQTAIRQPVESGGWKFDYSGQLLQNHPELHRRAIDEAHAASRETGIPLVYRQQY